MANDLNQIAPTAAPSAPATALIYDDWYPALRSDRLRGKRLTTAMLLGIPLVLGRRSDGAIFAMRDSCPHRGIPLSCGWFDGARVTCKYHGWAFEAGSGQCREIPSLTSEDTLDKIDRKQFDQNVAAWATLVWLAADGDFDLRAAAVAK